MSGKTYNLLLFCLLQFSLGAQIHLEMKVPQSMSQCQGLPIEVTIFNDGSEAITSADIQVQCSDEWTFRTGSFQGSKVSLSNPAASGGPAFFLPFLDVCESTSFIFWLDHICAEESHIDDFMAQIIVDGRPINSSIYPIQIFSPAIRMVGLGLFFDETDQKFKKKFTIINTGQVGLSSFRIFIEGDDHMDILSSNFGQLSANGDTIYFNDSDIVLIGNGNSFFETGESFEVIQEINIDACEEDFEIVHRLIIDCGAYDCDYLIESDVKLLVVVGNPRLVIYQDTAIFTDPCQDGEANLKLVNLAQKGTFDLGNSIYDLVLNVGWSLWTGSTRTEPRRDNCLRIKEAWVGNTRIALVTGGFSGYGLRFTQLTTDPDGPGGLDDLDGDGRYDDISPRDTVHLRLVYELDENCLRYSCSGEIFASRIMRLESDYRDYCNEPYDYSNYIGAHNYQWSQPYGGFSGLDGLYADEARDTLSIRLQRNSTRFLESCKEDSAVITIILPSRVELEPGAIIVLNGDTVNYTYSGNRIRIIADSSRFLIVVPLKFHCDPNQGSGGVNTPCTFCLGSGAPKYRLRVDVDYYCKQGCYPRIPLFCYSSPAFSIICDSAAVGAASEGKMIFDGMFAKRISRGFVDSTKNIRVSTNDSLDHHNLFHFDTFLLEIPIDIRCDANYTNVIFQLVQTPYYTYNNGVRDTFKLIQWLADTIKLYDGERNLWSDCIGALGNEYYSRNINNYNRRYVRQLNISNRLNSCLDGPLSSPDSMVIIVRGVIQNVFTQSLLRTTIIGDLKYTQDGCGQKEVTSLGANLFSTIPNIGSAFLNQEYLMDSLFKRYYSHLSVCGNFKLDASFDNYYNGLVNEDPLVNEYRNAYILDEIKFVIPPLFEYKRNNPNYSSQYLIQNPRSVKSDTSYLTPIVRDSLNYTIVIFNNFERNWDFKVNRHNFWLDLEPECYDFLTDTIKVHKKFRYYLHLDDQARHKDTTVTTKYIIQVSGVRPYFTEERKQLLKDTLAGWTFKLNSIVSGAEPAQYFTYSNVWLLMENLSQEIVIDSLVEYDSMGRGTIHAPIILTPQHTLYKMDALYEARDFKLFTRFNYCSADSLVIYTGNSCYDYPDDFLNVEGKCNDFLARNVLRYDPEDARINLVLEVEPDTSQSTPCDTFSYQVSVSNNGLGHAFNNKLFLTIPNGLTFVEASLEYLQGNFISLNQPLPSGKPNEYYWEIADTIFPEGFPGFYIVNQNEFKLRLKFVGDCNLDEGSTLSFFTEYTNVCNDTKTSSIINSNPFSFSGTTQNQGDLYDMSMSFSADTFCGEKFTVTVRVKMIALKDNPGALDQKVFFQYEKELSYIPSSFTQVKNIGVEPVGYRLFDDLETIEVPIDGNIARGDSVIFELTLERTCIELCKTTDFKLILNAPRLVGCSTVSGGMCQQLITVQEWRYDSIRISPTIIIEDSDLISRKGNGGNESVDVRFLLRNISPFTARSNYIVSFYYDANGNGLLDAGDVFIGKDSISGSLLEAYQSHWDLWSFDIPAEYSCRLIAAINLDDNECLCTGDTLALRPSSVIGELKHYRVCYDQSIQIGFDILPQFSVLWSDPARVSNETSAMTDYSYPLVLSPGQTLSDTLYLHVTKEAECDYIDTAVIEIYRLDANAYVLDEIKCHGDATGAVGAEGLGGRIKWKYKWEGRQDTTAEITGLRPGIYRVTVSDEFGCEAIDSIELTEPDSLKSDMQIETDYNGFDVSCNGSGDGEVSIKVDGGSPEYSYVWSRGNESDSTSTGLKSGMVVVTVTDENGCPIVDSILLNQPPPLDITGSTTPAGCDEDSGGSAIVNAIGGVGGFIYEWAHGQMGDSLGNLQSGKYEVRAIDANGCWIDTTFEVDQLPDPSISVNITDTTIEYGKSIRLSARTNALNPKFEWSPPDSLSCIYCPTTIASPTVTTTYTVRVTDENGCWAEETIIVRVIIVKRVWAPNVFTPGGDGLNDKFTIFGNEPLEIIEELFIYDRWGELVFVGENFPPNDATYGWDGTFLGEEMNPAVFVYVANVRFVDGERSTLSGDVTLLK